MTLIQCKKFLNIESIHVDSRSIYVEFFILNKLQIIKIILKIEVFPFVNIGMKTANISNISHTLSLLYEFY